MTLHQPRPRPLAERIRCRDKASYMTWGEGFFVAEKLWHKRGLLLSAYRCPVCHLVHLTSREPS